MCVYDQSADKVQDICQTIEQLERDLEKGDELVKCGSCYGDFNLFTRPDEIYQCSDGGSAGATTCGEDKHSGELKYPMCFWKAKKQQPETKCETVTDVEYELSNPSKKSEGDNMLLDCGFCEDLNLFEGYWEPPTLVTMPAEIDGCDWDHPADRCKNNESKKQNKGNDDDDDDDYYYPMCIWDRKKDEGKSKCQKVSKLNSLKKDEYLAGCDYCENILFL